MMRQDGQDEFCAGGNAAHQRNVLRRISTRSSIRLNTSAQCIFSENDLLCRGILNKTLPRSSLKMLFQHSPLPKHPELIGSYCLLCGKLVAAGLNTEILAIIERLHECPPLRKQRASQLPDAA